MIQVKKTTLSAAQIDAMNVTAITILPAAPIGSVNYVFGISVNQAGGTTPWATSPTLQAGEEINFTQNEGYWQGNYDFTTLNPYKAGLNPSSTTGKIFSGDIKIKSNDDLNGGDSELEVYIAYEEKIIS